MISPLLHPKVEIIIATAIIAAPAPGKITSAVAEPTRSLGTFLHVFESKRDEIGNIREQIKRDHSARAEQKRERKISFRIDDLARRECDVMPCISRKQRIRLGDADAISIPTKEARADAHHRLPFAQHSESFRVRSRDRQSLPPRSPGTNRDRR